jgi:hypothetical protein
MPVDIKRALKDKAYLDSLSEAEKKEFVEKTKGLPDGDLDQVSGGIARPTVPASGCGRK